MLSPVAAGEAVAAGGRLIDRCDNCGAGVERGARVDLASELELATHDRNGDERVIAVPNRASWQAAIGNDGWSALAEWPGHLLLTPKALPLLAERNGLVADDPAFPPAGPSQRWMWQTLLNGLTLHTDFASNVLAGRLQVGNSRGRLAFTVDAIASVLAAPLVALVSFPLEAIAALSGRGGRIVSRLRPARADRS